MNEFTVKVKEMSSNETVKELQNAFTAIGGSLTALEDDHRRRMTNKIEKDFKAKADAMIPKLEAQIVRPMHYALHSASYLVSDASSHAGLCVLPIRN